MRCTVIYADASKGPGICPRCHSLRHCEGPPTADARPCVVTSCDSFRDGTPPLPRDDQLGLFGEVETTQEPAARDRIPCRLRSFCLLMGGKCDGTLYHKSEVLKCARYTCLCFQTRKALPCGLEAIAEHCVDRQEREGCATCPQAAAVQDRQ